MKLWRWYLIILFSFLFLLLLLGGDAIAGDSEVKPYSAWFLVSTQSLEADHRIVHKLSSHSICIWCGQPSIMLDLSIFLLYLHSLILSFRHADIFIFAILFWFVTIFLYWWLWIKTGRESTFNIMREEWRFWHFKRVPQRVSPFKFLHWQTGVLKSYLDIKGEP